MDNHHEDDRWRFEHRHSRMSGSDSDYTLWNLDLSHYVSDIAADGHGDWLPKRHVIPKGIPCSFQWCAYSSVSSWNSEWVVWLPLSKVSRVGRYLHSFMHFVTISNKEVLQTSSPDYEMIGNTTWRHGLDDGELVDG